MIETVQGVNKIENDARTVRDKDKVEIAQKQKELLESLVADTRS